MPCPAKAASPWTSKGRNFRDAVLSGAVLLGAGPAHGHGIHRFQVAGIRDQVNMNFRPRAGHVFAGRAHVIFHVAAAQNAARIHVLKPRKNFLRRALGHLHNNVQPAAVAHAHHQFHRALLPGRVQNFIHQRDHGGHAFERETLAAQIALLQHLLEQISPDQLVEHALLVHRGLRPFHALLYPAPPLGVGNVHEFRAHGSAVDAAGFIGQFAFDPQAGMRHGRQKSERVEIGLQISPVAKRVEYRAHVRRWELPARRLRQIH